MKKVKIFIADDHEVIRDGIRALLERSEKFDVVGEAGNGEEALNKIAVLKPDIVLMDISMPATDGLTATKHIKDQMPDSNIIILSMHVDAEHISACLSLDVSGYVVKTAGGKEVISAIEAVLAGKKFYSEEVTKVILGKYKELHESVQQKREQQGVELTAREKEVIGYVASGLTNQQIAEKLFLSFRTIETHRANLMRKLEAKNSVDLINKARAKKLID